MRSLGHVHFDDDETFTVNGGDGVDLLWVAVHELGHSLGMNDNYHPSSVLFSFYKGYTPNLQLEKDYNTFMLSFYWCWLQPDRK